MTQTSLATKLAEWRDKGGLERLDRATKPGKFAKVTSILCTLLLIIATTLAMIQPAEAANDIDADSYSGKVHWLLKARDVHSDGTQTCWWQLVDADGNPVDSISKSGTKIDFGNEVPRGQSGGIWATTSGVDAMESTNRDAYYRDRPSSWPKGANQGPSIPTHIFDPDAAEVPQDISKLGGSYNDDPHNNSNQGTDSGITERDINDGLNKSAKVGDNDWIRGYATGETDGEGNVVGEGFADGNAKKPDFNITDFWGSVVKCLIRFIYTTFIAPLILWVTKIIGWLLSLINPKALFVADFQYGSYAKFYDMGRIVSSAIAGPYAALILGISIVAGVARIASTRRHEDPLQNLMTYLLTVAIAYTLVTNAYVLFRGAYELTNMLTGFATTELTHLGHQATGIGLGNTIVSMMTKRVAELTYANFGASFLWIIMIFWMLITALKYVIHVFVIAFSRMVELYLYAAFSPVPLSFFAMRSTRHMGIKYIQRFGSVAILSVIIVVTLAMTPAITNIASTIISQTVEGQGDPVTAVAAAAAPIVISISLASTIIDKSEGVSKALFGLV